MTPEFAYLLKVNVAFVLFYAFYRLFFYKDTFFKLRRAILLAFFGLALFYPLLNIQDWVRQQEPIADVIYMYSAMLPEATAKADAAASVDWYGWLLGSLGFIYWGIVAFLCGRFLVQLSSILWLAHTSERVVIHETPVYALRKAAGPFSFFRMVFLHPESHSDKETDEILTHECTHVSQWHSIDVILSEMMCMACWFNPFVWLLKREVRHNLEYLADNTVIQSGYDIKNCRAMAERFAQLGMRMVTGGTDNHLLLIDLPASGADVSGKAVQDALDSVNITLNKNCVPDEKRSPMQTSGVRIGTAAMTTRGFSADDFRAAADIVTDAIRSLASGGFAAYAGSYRERVAEIITHCNGVV